MKIKQRIPNFCEGITPKEATVQNVSELLQLDWVNSWSKHDDFYQFSKTDKTLMAEFDYGKTFWTVGYLFGCEDLDLPEFIPKDKENQIRQQKTVVSSDKRNPEKVCLIDIDDVHFVKVDSRYNIDFVKKGLLITRWRYSDKRLAKLDYDMVRGKIEN